MHPNREKFDAPSDKFFKNGLEKSNLDQEITVEKVISWFDEVPSEEEVNEVYWIDEPFCFASIYEKEEETIYGTYEVEEQDSNIRDFVLESIGYDISDMEVDYPRLFAACDSILDMVENKNLEVDNYPDLYHAERYSSGFMDLYPYTQDVAIEDVSYNGLNSTFVFHSEYKSIPSSLKISEKDVDKFVRKLLENFGHNNNTGLVEKNLNSNVSIVATFSSKNDNLDGTTFTLKTNNTYTFTPIDLYESNTYSSEALSYLWLAIENNMSVLVGGGSSSGKTSTIEALLHFTGKFSKIVSVENQRELSIPHKNWISSSKLDDSAGENIGIYGLTRSALKQRPEYLVVDELRGQEAETVFQAMTTGHTVLSTVHAETVATTVGRLTNPPINVPKKMIMALEIICIQNNITSTEENSQSETIQKAEEIREIVNLRDNGNFENRRPFQWDAETDTFISSVEGSTVVDKISKLNNISKEEVLEDMNTRKELIELVSNSDINESDSIREIITKYQNNAEFVMKKARENELEKLISANN